MSTVKEDKRFLELLEEFVNREKDNNSDIWNDREEFKQLWLEIDRINIREYPEKGHAIIMQLLLDLKVMRDTEDIFEVEDPEELKDLGMNIGLNWASPIARYFTLIPPYVKIGSKIPKNIKDLYAESRYCYIYGNLNATIVLSRAILEAVLKERFLLPKNGNDWTAGKALKRLFEKKTISENVFKPGWQIVIEANDIVHEAKVASETKAKEIIRKTKDFLEEIYS